MIKVLRCRELMPGCDHVARAENDSALLENLAAHALSVHGVALTEEMAQRLAAAIRVEQLSAAV